MALTRYARILWVDPPVSVATTARNHGVAARRIMPSLSVIDDRITRFRTVAIPGLTRPGIRATTAPLVRAQVQWAVHRQGIKPFAVVAGYLDDLLGRWGGAVNVVYSTDDHVAGAGLMGLSADRIRAQERQAVARADVLVVVSPKLADHWSALGADPVLIPNGCFPAYASVDSPSAVATGLPRPVVGLVGNLNERIDIGILEAVADAGFSLLLVGPHDERWARDRFAALTARPGVEYAGRVPADKVPSYLAAIDVGITPYQNTPFNYASFPIKTLEYLSAGRPVVSTDLPGSRWLLDDLASTDPAPDQLLALARDPAEFVVAVRRLAGEPGSRAQPGAKPEPAGPPQAERGRAFADRHSWQRRADVFASAIGLSPAHDNSRSGPPARV
jgi:teichuronic acid biosynthesis glycosyltransferase TuaH